MAVETRLYTVTEVATGKRRLIEASHPAQALRHCAANAYQVEIAAPKDVAELMTHGIEVEVAKAGNGQQGNLTL